MPLPAHSVKKDPLRNLGLKLLWFGSTANQLNNPPNYVLCLWGSLDGEEPAASDATQGPVCSWAWRPFCLPFLIGLDSASRPSLNPEAEWLLIKGKGAMKPPEVRFKG